MRYFIIGIISEALAAYWAARITQDWRSGMLVLALCSFYMAIQQINNPYS